MKITKYTWDQYLSTDIIHDMSVKLEVLFQIRDNLFQADNESKDKIVIKFDRTKDYKWILGLAGGLHRWWVIDFVIEEENRITLLYRNCRIHKESNPSLLWGIYTDATAIKDTRTDTLRELLTKPKGVLRK